MKYYFVGIWQLLASIIALGAAICTITPNEAASITNFLGYRSTCPMVPISTFICLSVSGAAFYLWRLKRKSFFEYTGKLKKKRDKPYNNDDD